MNGKHVKSRWDRFRDYSDRHYPPGRPKYPLLVRRDGQAIILSRVWFAFWLVVLLLAFVWVIL